MPKGVYDHHKQRGRKRPNHSVFMRKKWQDPLFREVVSEKVGDALRGITKEMNPNLALSEATKEKQRKAMKKHWQDPIYIEKQLALMFKRFDFKQNKSEKLLDELLQKWFPDEYKFVGDGQIFIGRKCPDFINVNNQKNLIEMFGDFYHSEKYRLLSYGDIQTNKEHEKQRIDHFAKYGYQTLIIWEHELLNTKTLRKRLNKFYLCGISATFKGVQ